MAQSDLFNQASQGYLSQALQPSAPSALNTQSNVPLNQRSFAMPNAVQVMSDPGPAPAPSFVPGIGMLGPDLGGAVKGVQALQQFQMNAAENQRANEKIGMEKAKLGQDQDYLRIAQGMLAINLNKESREAKTVEQEQAITAGMQQAAANGGIPAVIDYLTNADPFKAVQLKAATLALDANIMQNDTYRLAHENDKSKAMMEGYQLLGSMGATLLNAPADQRADIYKNLLPIAKQIDPSMPDELNTKAIATLGLGMSLSTPASILYNAKKQGIEYQSQTGKALGDLQAVISKYGPDSAQAKILGQNLNNIFAQQDKNQLQIASVIANNQQTGENQLRNQWLGISKDMGQMAQSNSAVQLASKSAQNPDGTIKGPDDMAIIYNYYKMLDPTSVIMPGEYANAENTRGWSDAMRVQYNKVIDGSKLDDRQRNAFAKSAQMLFDNKSKSYYALKSQFREIAKRKNFDPDNITVDRIAGYENSQGNQPTLTKTEIDQMADQAIASGKKDPQAILQLKQELYKKNGINVSDPNSDNQYQQQQQNMLQNQQGIGKLGISG